MYNNRRRVSAMDMKGAAEVMFVAEVQSGRQKHRWKGVVGVARHGVTVGTANKPPQRLCRCYDVPQKGRCAVALKANTGS